MSSSSVVALTPNCLIQLDKREIPEEVSEGTADPKDAAEQRVGRGSQSAAPWGLDRIDARYGLDGTYNYDTARGQGVKICALLS